MPERHSRVIGAGLGASLTHPIRVPSPAGVANGIDVGTIVRRSCDRHAIPVNIDVGRGRSAPGETHRIYSLHLAPHGTERDLWRTGLRAVSPTGFEKVNAILSAPNDHLAIGPHCSVSV